MTYVGNAAVTAASNPFVVTPVKLSTDTLTSRNGLPTFNPTIAGITNTAAYFLMDFTSDYTMLWNTACITTGFGGYTASSCENAPTLMNLDFDQTNNSTGLIHALTTFTDISMGGFTVSGTRYTTQMCLNAESTSCKILYIYSGESVSADNWLFNSDATSGIIGMGPGSSFWNGLTDPSTLTSTYSIALARISYFTES